MKKEKSYHIITGVSKGSIAEELGIEAGDKLLLAGGKEIKDVFDYHYLTNEEHLTVLIEKPDGEEWELEIEKEYEEDLGLLFEEGLMDEYRSCRNKCMFCFIDQMPPGMRETLYFKDDDARLSFLQGNYVTMTNMSDEDVERILFYKLSPINISVHTTNPELRCKMLNNRFAGQALEKLQKFKDAGIEMNGQIVLCKGYNDKEELDHTISDLSAYLPCMKSVSVVPVGLTKYREGLAHLSKFTKEDALEVITQIEGWQKKLFAEKKTRFVYASDEWYLTAELPIPSASSYESYRQLENGVGMVRLLSDEVDEYLNTKQGDERKRNITLATGVLAAPIIEEQIRKIQKKYPNIKAEVVPIVNYFFGEDITVAGLLTGQDIVAQLKGKELGEALLLPVALFRSGEDVLLDDMTLSDMEKALQTKIHIVQSEGKFLVDTVIKK